MQTFFNINYEFNIPAIHAEIDKKISEGGTGYICVADGNILQMVHRDPEYRKIVNGGMFSICDSSWVPVFLRKIHGISVSQYCGSQIFEDIVKSKKYRMFFLGSSDEILASLREQLSSKYDPRIRDMQFVSLPFLDVEQFDYAAIAAKINADKPDIIWVALGAPKQERFMRNLQPYLEKGVQIAVGAVFKFYGGEQEKRAPKWMIASHMEFIYRIFQDPRKQLLRCRDILVTLPSILRDERRK